MNGILHGTDVALPRDPVEAMHAATKRYVDQQIIASMTGIHVLGVGMAATYDVETVLSGSPDTIPTCEAVIRYVDNSGIGGVRTAFYLVANQSALTSLANAIPGDMGFAVASRNEGIKPGLYILMNAPPTLLGNWKQVSFIL